jgi:class 3 adenylate cyclase/tetratricopeptide (TPR) repeat protein
MAITEADRRLEPYVPRLVVNWLRETPDAVWREVEGSLAFVDISGFTQLTERLARRGKVGAEEMSDLLNGMFAELLAVAYQDDAGLVKWGGDAVLLLFEGEEHAQRAVRAAARMRSRLRQVGKLQTPAGLVTLRMSVGIHSGTFHFFLVGDPQIHRELIISGPAASLTAELEALADAGEIAVSEATKALLPDEVVGAAKGIGWLVAREPRLIDVAAAPRPSSVGLDIAGTLPPPIREHLRSNSGTAEHRRIAVAFVQFSGTDEVLATQGPAALAAALDETVRNVQEAAGRHGVTFFESDINRDGGKIMLTAGAPLSSDHDEEGMVRTARRIADRIGRLPLRVGVNSGPVFAGDFGPEFRKTFSVKGDAINLAARVMGKAQPGQVLVTVDTLAKATSSFDVEVLPPFLVKGKSKPVHAVSLGRVLGERTRSDDSPMVGRETELAVLRSSLAWAKEGSRQVVDLAGEPGIGKSRLVQELLRDQSVQAVTARCDEYETATAYWPFRNLLRELLGIAEHLSVDDVVDQLRDTTKNVAPDLLPWLPLICQVVDVTLTETPEVAALAVEFRKSRLEEVTAEFLRTLLPGPVVLVFDDVHLIDDASADLLEVLCRSSEHCSWLMLVTRREVASGFLPSDAYEVMPLRPAPLDDIAVTAMISAVLAERPLPPDDIAALRARAGGNPLFLRGLLDAVRTGAALDSLPDSVEALITSQIDRLPPDERSVLRFASVLGVSFRESELRALLRGRALPTSRSALRNLGHFLRIEGHGRLRFDHQLIRDTAYEGLPYRLRRELHGRAGEVIEAAAPDPIEVSELLSLHFFHAVRPEKAWFYSRVAGMRASEKFAFAQADELLTRAVQSVRGSSMVTSEELAEVQLALGEARFRIGRNSLALQAFRAARAEMAEDRERCAVVFKREAETEWRQGRTSQALRTLKRGMGLLDGLGSDAALSALSRLEGTYAVVRENQGRYRESLRWALAAEQHAEQAGDRAALADALSAVHGARSMLGDVDDRAYGEEALALYESLGDRVGQSRALNNLAVLAWIQGSGPRSLEMFRRAEILAAEAGDTVGAASTKYNIGDVLVRMGKVVEAANVLREVIPVLQGTGIEDFHMAARRGLGLALVMDGADDEGRRLLVEARSAFVEMRESAEVVETDATLALAFLIAGEWRRAADLASDAAARADEMAAGYLLPWLLRLHGAALSDGGEPAAARRTLRRALELADAQSRIERGFILAELATLELRSGNAELSAEYESASSAAFDLLGFEGSRRYPRGGAPQKR